MYYLLRSLILSAIIMICVISIFMNAFGGNILVDSVTSDDKRAIHHSKIMYLTACIVGQCVFSLITGMKGGIIMLPTIASESKQIYAECKASKPDGHLINTLLCLFAASFFSGLLNTFLSICNVGKYIQHIPLTLVCVSMIAASSDFLIGSFAYYKHVKAYPLFIGISISLTLIGILIYRKFKNPMSLFLYFSFVVILSKVLCYVRGSNVFYGIEIFPTNTQPLSYKTFAQDVLSERLELSFLKENWLIVFFLAFKNSISFAINLPFYAQAIDTFYNFNTELFTLGISNIATSLVPMPVSFIGSGSIMFHVSGLTKPLYSFFGALACISLFFLYHKIILFIPVFLTSLVSQFAGLSFIISYGLIICKSSFRDALVVVIGILFLSFSSLSFSWVVLAILVSDFCLILDFKLKAFPRSFPQVSNPSKIVVTGCLAFYNISSIISKIKRIAEAGERTIELNLNGCEYIDMSANFELYNTIKSLSASSNTTFVFDGTPYNFYSHLYSNISGFTHNCTLTKW